MKLLTDFQEQIPRWHDKTYLNQIFYRRAPEAYYNTIEINHNSNYVPLSKVDFGSIGYNPHTYLIKSIVGTDKVGNAAINSFASGNKEEFLTNTEGYIRNELFNKVSSGLYLANYGATLRRFNSVKALSRMFEKLNKTDFVRDNILVHSCVMYKKKPAGYKPTVYNNAFGIEEYLNSNKNFNIFPVLMLAVHRKYVPKLKYLVMFDRTNEIDYSYIKLLVNPGILGKKSSEVKIKNFINKFLQPVLDKNGVEIIECDLSHHITTMPKFGYNTEKLKQVFLLNKDRFKDEVVIFSNTDGSLRNSVNQLFKLGGLTDEPATDTSRLPF